MSYSEYISKQETYCKEHNYPVYIAKNGVCFQCEKNIFENEDTRNNADKSLITGCPFCYCTYCD